MRARGAKAGFRPRIMVPLPVSLVKKRKPRGPLCMKCTFDRAQAAGRGKNYLEEDECWILEDVPPSDRLEDWHLFELVDNTEGMPKSHILLRVRHHREEMVVRFDLGTQHWVEDDLERAVKTQVWFMPEDEIQT